MAASIENIKNIMSRNGFISTEQNTLDGLAKEISESVEGINDKRAMADTIYGNLVGAGVSFRDVDNLMGIAEKIASSI